MRSNENNEVGFLSDARRMNVAVTRARKHVTLICNCETVSKDAFLANLVQYFEENGDLVSSAPASSLRVVYFVICVSRNRVLQNCVASSQCGPGLRLIARISIATSSTSAELQQSSVV